MFGFEESYGYLVKPFVRDKDAIKHLSCWLKSLLFINNRTKHFYDGLQDIFEEYGYYAEKTISVTMSGMGRCSQNHCIDENIPRKSTISFRGYTSRSNRRFQRIDKSWFRWSHAKK